MAINIEEVIQYYQNLLIIQYNQKEKAKAEIELFVKTLLNDDIYSKVREGFDLETATGKQLDILGKIIGVDRFYEATGIADGSNWQLANYIGNINEIQIADYNNNIFGGEVVEYSDLQLNNRLSDINYRFILKLKIIQNNSNHSEKSIDDGLFLFFGDELVQSPSDNMTMVYFVKSDSIKSLALIAFSKKVLPRPMGVNLSGLIVRNKPFFGFKTYNTQIVNSNIAGFANYDNTAFTNGEMLTYDKIINL